MFVDTPQTTAKITGHKLLVACKNACLLKALELENGHGAQVSTVSSSMMLE